MKENDIVVYENFNKLSKNIRKRVIFSFKVEDENVIKKVKDFAENKIVNYNALDKFIESSSITEDQLRINYCGLPMSIDNKKVRKELFTFIEKVFDKVYYERSGREIQIFDPKKQLLIMRFKLDNVIPLKNEESIAKIITDIFWKEQAEMIIKMQR
ncbi:hypothetical protein Bp8pS_075 [Bacillus phage vB_BpuM-BpSp]|nr:hypothetical protein Bp8pS_075 [Bacillus phage vB_BpuM-BpSp]